MDVTTAVSAARWNALTEDERRAVAGQLLRQLPQGFSLVGVEGRVARFEHDDRTFALVPGGPARIGFDVTRWQPSKDERKSWARTVREHRLPELHDYLAQVTRRPREVEVTAMLVATRPEDVGWEPLALGDPRVAEFTRDVERAGSPTIRGCSGDAHFELSYVDGRLSGAWLARKATHAELAAGVERAGFRLPTSDEWEYLCGAGSSTLFRWGDHAPCDRYPPDLSVEEAEFRATRVTSGGQLKPPPGGFVSDWDLHRQPNGLGLHIAADPYQYELVAEADVTRGGDGGSMICGGVGYFMGWLPLATAWFDPAFCRRDPAAPIEVGYTVMRRVLPLSGRGR
jgi:hypothetical protein